jgi:hypothetical protein
MIARSSSLMSRAKVGRGTLEPKTKVGIPGVWRCRYGGGWASYPTGHCWRAHPFPSGSLK